MRCQVAPRGIGVLLGLEATFHPFMGFPSYKAIATCRSRSACAGCATRSSRRG